MTIELRAIVEPAVWPERELRDVTIELTLRNNSKRPVTIYPQFTALSWKASVASMGMSWILRFTPLVRGASASGHELRTYYGPPGEPVSEEALRKSGLILKPDEEKKTSLSACFIPHVLLDPASLSLAVLDPRGHDDLKSVAGLERSSVLVFATNSRLVEKELGKKKDFLRGHLVVFFNAKGKYILTAEYEQSPVMSSIVERIAAVAKPVEVKVGDST